MSSHTRDEEEWLDVAMLDMSGATNSAQSVIPIRGGPDNVPVTSEAISTSTLVEAGVDNEIVKAAKTKTASIETGSLYRSMRENAEKLLKSKKAIFRADLGDERHAVRNAFNSGLPSDYQQEFNCTACRRFMKGFGDLAMVDAATGNLIPLFWNSEFQTDFYRKPVEEVMKLFDGRKVRQAFLVTEKTLNTGIFEAGSFLHMSFKFPPDRLCAVEPRGFASATTSELAEMLDRVLRDNHVSTIHHAADLLLEDKLPYADKHKAAIRWLRNLIDKGQLTTVVADSNRHNLLYLAASDSFLGCINQLRSGTLSKLLEDIQLETPFPVIESNWRALADPMAYMRPTAAPSAGNIAAAERLFAELGLSQNDLRRKYLVMNDLPPEVLMWRSPIVPKPTSGIFSHLASKESPPQNIIDDDPSIPWTSLTFASFMNRIVPTANYIEYHLSTHPPHHFLLTGLPGTNPLMQWHTPTNLVSNYIYHKAKAVETHNLKAGWSNVTAIIPSPQLWEGIPATSTLPLADELFNPDFHGNDSSAKIKPYKHAQHGWRYLICLEGIEDQYGSSALFPTYLRHELHGVRSTIEAFSNSQAIERTKSDGPMVGGIMVAKDEDSMKHMFRVRDSTGKVSRYRVILFQ